MREDEISRHNSIRPKIFDLNRLQCLLSPDASRAQLGDPGYLIPR